MKQLSDCKEYFNDLLFNCLDAGACGKNIYDSAEKAQFEMFCNTLKFVYGTAFEAIRPTWTQEALNKYYSNI